MSSHYAKKCDHGIVVEQCRCPSPSKTWMTVPCPDSCSQKNEFQEDAGRHVGYVPYFDCPRCGRHRLEATFGVRYVGDNKTASYIALITCEKCGWDSSVGAPITTSEPPKEES